MAVIFSKKLYPDENSTITTSGYYIENGVTITVKANAGFVIKSVHVDLYFNAARTIKESFTVAEAVGKTEHSFMIDGKYKRTTGTSATAEVFATTEPAGSVTTYSEALNKVTSSHVGTSVKREDVITFTTVGQSRFDGDVAVVFTKGGVPETVLFNKGTHPKLFNAENNTFTLTLADYWSENLESVAVTANAKDYVIFTGSITNATTNIPSNEVQQNDVLIITANKGYTFDTHEADDIKIVTTVNGKDTTHSFDPHWNEKYFSENGTVLTVPLAEIWATGITKVHVIAKAEQIPTPTVTVHQDYVNVTSSLGAGDSEGTVYNVPINTVVTLTAIDGYVFQDGIQISWLSEYGNPPNRQTYHPTSESDAHYFNEDKTVFTISLNEHANYDTGFVSINAIAKQKYLGNDTIQGRTTAFANIYYADDSVLSNLVSDRWLNIGSTYIDFGEYIYQVYKYPIKIDTEEFVSTDPIPIQLGRHTGKTQSRYFLRSRVKFSLGKIAVPEEYGNVYDYRDVTCLLHLPYANPIEVDFTYVIGTELDLFYLLDLYNGTTTLEVYSSKINGGLVLRQDIQVAYEIPFMKQAYNDVKGNIGRYISNRVQTPYVEVIRPIPYDTLSEQGKEGKEVGKLGDFTGYVEVRDVKLVGTITEQEREKIINLLTNGVYINRTEPPKPKDH